MNVYAKLGVIFLIVSGIFYTLERIVAKFIWALEISAVKLSPSGGSYSSYPDMPNLSENIFVIAFLILGIILIIWGLLKK
ncbi:hypothetical protein [Marinitoga sp. 38H-ov]|uniref:hypothetical protein n=1 Tax=Marinitoga sp. 38H-ov TaxID=1755814 RepID=UPI0013EB64E0|nr:hypothetical protein [Marinitoga sp. 38H-ov]KAF2955149.1 hypothetical protein AS160_02085 [Marinitoga sp. 38H-ov]